MMLMELELPFCGPHTSWKSSPGDHWKSLTLPSPSMMKEMLNCSSNATRFCTLTLMVFWAQSDRAVAIRHIMDVIIFPKMK